MTLVALCLSALMALESLSDRSHAFTPVGASASAHVPQLRWAPEPLPVHLGSAGRTDRGRGLRLSSVPGLDRILDVSGRRGRLSFGDDDTSLLLHFDWRSGLDANSIRIRSRLNLALFGRTIALAPPDLRIGPRFGGGGTDFIFQLPLLERRF